MLLKSVILSFSTLCLMGCTTLRPIDTREVDLADQLEAGDHVVVYERTGRIIDMTYIEVDGERVRGRLTDGSLGPISVAVEDIEKIEVEKIDGAKTTLAVIGGTIVIVPLALVAVLVGGLAAL